MINERQRWAVRAKEWMWSRSPSNDKTSRWWSVWTSNRQRDWHTNSCIASVTLGGPCWNSKRLCLYYLLIILAFTHRVLLSFIVTQLRYHTYYFKYYNYLRRYHHFEWLLGIYLHSLFVVICTKNSCSLFTYTFSALLEFRLAHSPLHKI